MNNLKRVLSLALASVMLIGMMAVGASAFDDDADIENKEAVNTMVALNIINGYPDGSYKPDELLLREQAAKMVFVALNGGKTNDNLTTKATPTYTDIKGNWAEGYIEWCSNRGIIAGYGDGTFNPKGQLTGTALAKIMLVAIGYDAKTEGLEGTSDWALNVNSLALAKGFYDDLDGIDPEAPISRDNGAQLILNACKAKMVEYDYKVVGNNGNIDTKAISKDVNTTILGDKYDLYTAAPAILTGVTLQDTGTYKGTYNLSIGGVANTYTRVKEDYSALLGQQVSVLGEVNAAGNGVKTTGVYGVFATDTNTVVTAKKSAVAAVTGNTTTKVSVGGTTYEGNAAVNSIVDGAYTANAGNLYNLAFNADKTSYDEVTLIDNTGDGKIDLVVTTTVTPVKVTYKSSTEIIAGGTTYKYADNDIASDVAKGDYVTVIANPIVNAELENKIEKITSATATITGVKAAASGAPQQFQLDGTWYYDTAAVSGAKAGDEIEFYALNGIILSGAKTSVTTLDDVVMLVNAAAGLQTQVKFLQQDGTTVTGNLDPNSSAIDTTAGTSTDAGKLYTVKTTSNGYKLTLVSDNIGDYTWVTAALTVAESGTPSTIKTIASKDIADEAVIMALSANGATKIYTGKEFKTFNAHASTTTMFNTTAKGAFTSTVNNLDRVSIAAVKFNGNTLPTAAGEAKSYGLIVTAPYTVKDGVTYDVWTGSEKVTVVDEDSALSVSGSSNVVAKGDVIRYSAITDGTIADVATLAAATGNALGNSDGSGLVTTYIRSVSGKYLYLGGDSETTDKYETDSDTVVMYYDSAATAGAAGGELVAADKDVTGTAYIQNVKVIVNDSKDVLFVLADVKNNISTKYNVTSTMTDSTNFKVTTTAAGTTVKAGAEVTVTVTAANDNNAEAKVKVHFGTQEQVVTVPAGTASTKGSATATFVMPAANVTTVSVKEAAAASAYTLKSTNTGIGSDGVGSFTAVVGFDSVAVERVGSGDVYAGDTVRYKVTFTFASGTTEISAAGKVTLTNAAVVADSTATPLPAGATIDTTNTTTQYNLSATATKYAGGALYVDVTAGTAGTFVLASA